MKSKRLREPRRVVLSLSDEGNGFHRKVQPALGAFITLLDNRRRAWLAMGPAKRAEWLKKDPVISMARTLHAITADFAEGSEL